MVLTQVSGPSGQMMWIRAWMPGILLWPLIISWFTGMYIVKLLSRYFLLWSSIFRYPCYYLVSMVLFVRYL